VRCVHPSPADDVISGKIIGHPSGVRCGSVKTIHNAKSVISAQISPSCAWVVPSPQVTPTDSFDRIFKKLTFPSQQDWLEIQLANTDFVKTVDRKVID